mmetsp:Transcript_28396/g.84542  ORF Transcript_28396/g.84542 Transcript_28396/m.84542 type:complete len:203 (-) Transcript_28396:14-622(-)
MMLSRSFCAAAIAASTKMPVRMLRTPKTMTQTNMSQTMVKTSEISATGFATRAHSAPPEMGAKRVSMDRMTPPYSFSSDCRCEKPSGMPIMPLAKMLSSRAGGTSVTLIGTSPRDSWSRAGRPSRKISMPCSIPTLIMNMTMNTRKRAQKREVAEPIMERTIFRTLWRYLNRRMIFMTFAIRSSLRNRMALPTLKFPPAGTA